MATYKVLQDIEAEDKLLGPLTLKQFIFLAITIGIGFIEFTLLTNSALGVFRWPFVLVLLPPLFVFGFLAAPISREQSNDIWLLARLRFLLKPHQRIWNQDGISQLVTITVPKHIEHIFTNGLNQNEVKSRLQALANTVDSRGWAIKNVNTNLYAQPGYLNDAGSDRLVDPSALPQDVPIADIQASDDMLDPINNSTAQHLDMLVQASTQAHRQEAIGQMHPDSSSQKPADYWFMNKTAPPQGQLPQDYATFSQQQVVAPGAEDDAHPAAQPTVEEEALASRIAEQHRMSAPVPNPHIKTLRPLHDREGHILQPPQAGPSQLSTAQPASDRSQEPANPAILGLAHNDDLNVATIARQAQKLSEDDEVVISLH